VSVSTDLESALGRVVETGACPHLAILLRTAEELGPVLASFYALGARRGAWCFHRSLPGQGNADREMLRAGGLDVAGLERAGALVVADYDFTKDPAESVARIRSEVAVAIDDGFSGAWYSRFATGTASPELLPMILRYEKALDECFADLPVVALCPYIVGDDTLAGELIDIHDGLASEHADGHLTVELHRG
jgi:hypothetical protein